MDLGAATPARAALRRTAGFVLLVGLALTLVVGSALLVIGGRLDDSGTEIARIASPDGWVELVVVQSSAVIDDVWKLRIHRAGARGQGLDAGCLNGDDPDDAYRSAAWSDGRPVQVTLADGRQLTAAIDARGRPDRRLTSGAGC